MQTLTILYLFAGASAFTQPVLRARSSATRAAVRLEAGGSFSDAFAKLAKKNRPLKPGEGAPTRADVRGLPIRKGGTVRDGSLGDIRAALQLASVLKDPRNWQAEEFGLVGVIGFIAASFIYGYVTYVNPPEKGLDAPPSAAVVARRNKLNACGDDEVCKAKAIDDTEAAVEKDRLLQGCLNDAFGGTEKRMCQSKYGGKAFLGYF